MDIINFTWWNVVIFLGLTGVAYYTGFLNQFLISLLGLIIIKVILAFVVKKAKKIPSKGVKSKKKVVTVKKMKKNSTTTPKKVETPKKAASLPEKISKPSVKDSTKLTHHIEKSSSSKQQNIGEEEKKLKYLQEEKEKALAELAELDRLREFRLKEKEEIEKSLATEKQLKDILIKERQEEEEKIKSIKEKTLQIEVKPEIKPLPDIKPEKTPLSPTKPQNIQPLTPVPVVPKLVEPSPITPTPIKETATSQKSPQSLELLSQSDLMETPHDTKHVPSTPTAKDFLKQAQVTKSESKSVQQLKNERRVLSLDEEPPDSPNFIAPEDKLQIIASLRQEEIKKQQLLEALRKEEEKERMLLNKLQEKEKHIETEQNLRNPFLLGNGDTIYSLDDFVNHIYLNPEIILTHLNEGHFDTWLEDNYGIDYKQAFSLLKNSSIPNKKKLDLSAKFLKYRLSIELLAENIARCEKLEMLRSNFNIRGITLKSQIKKPIPPIKLRDGSVIETIDDFSNLLINHPELFFHHFEKGHFLPWLEQFVDLEFAFAFEKIRLADLSRDEKLELLLDFIS